MGKRIRLSESRLRSIIRESVKRALREEEEKSEIRILMDKMHNTNDVRKVLQYAKQIEELIKSGEVDGFAYRTDGSNGERPVQGVCASGGGFEKDLSKKYGG